MRRFLGTKISLVVLGMLAAVLSVGVAWAAGAPGPWSQIALEPQTSEIVITPWTVEEGTPSLKILGSGFIPNELIFIQVERAEAGSIVLPGIRANENRAFYLELDAFPVELTPGIYTIKAAGTRGSAVATHGLIVVASK